MAGLGKGNNACSVLNSYHQGSKYELVEECGPPHMKEFTFSVNVLGQNYIGKGRSKKLAKQAAAATALRSLYNINLSLGVEETHSLASTGKLACTNYVYICSLFYMLIQTEI